MATEISQEHVDTEILPFLSADARADLQCIAVQYFLGLTGKLLMLLTIGCKNMYEIFLI